MPSVTSSVSVVAMVSSVAVSASMSVMSMALMLVMSAMMRSPVVSLWLLSVSTSAAFSLVSPVSSGNLGFIFVFFIIIFFFLWGLVFIIVIFVLIITFWSSWSKVFSLRTLDLEETWRSLLFEFWVEVFDELFLIVSHLVSHRVELSEWVCWTLHSDWLDFKFKLKWHWFHLSQTSAFSLLLIFLGLSSVLSSFSTSAELLSTEVSWAFLVALTPSLYLSSVMFFDNVSGALAKAVDHDGTEAYPSQSERVLSEDTSSIPCTL